MRVIAWHDAALDPPPHKYCGEYWGTNYVSDDVLCIYKDDKGNEKMAVCYHLLDGTWRAHGEYFNVIYWTPLPKMPKKRKEREPWTI